MRRVGRTLRGEGKWVLLSAVLLSVLVSPLALAGDGDVMRVGAGNSSETAETRIIGQNVSTYATRQSNNKEGDGGSATYGCRSSASNEPCLFVFALRTARAFDFISRGQVGGSITVSGDANPDNNKPFTTNATGVATGLNSDRVDSKGATDIAMWGILRFTGGANVTLLRAYGATAVQRVGTGNYRMTFSRDVSTCAFQATAGNYGGAGQNPFTDPVVAMAANDATNTMRAFVKTADSKSGNFVDADVSVTALC
jgi:hypothetical protein